MKKRETWLGMRAPTLVALSCFCLIAALAIGGPTLYDSGTAIINTDTAKESVQGALVDTTEMTQMAVHVEQLVPQAVHDDTGSADGAKGILEPATEYYTVSTDYGGLAAERAPTAKTSIMTMATARGDTVVETTAYGGHAAETSIKTMATVSGEEAVQTTAYGGIEPAIVAMQAKISAATPLVT